MGDPHVHKGSHEAPLAETARATNGPRGRVSMRGILVIALAIAAVVLMVVLHLTGIIGPGSH